MRCPIELYGMDNNILGILVFVCGPGNDRPINHKSLTAEVR